jgi:predicted phage baseplate assembly protein
VASEIAWTAEALTADPQAALYLKAPLKGKYERGSVRIAANVVCATQGETRNEILGSGDASAPFQRFTLKATPLTYVPSADSPTGGMTTLSVRANGVQWREHRALYGLGQRDRAYIVRINDEGKAEVAFGDGPMGARLPSGVENVEAHYRVGAGLAGMVKAGQLSLLTNPPLGVKQVSNPFEATGGSNPETSDRARDHAPLTVRTLDRTVSLDDFEAFAAAFSGIGKAQASWLWNGESRVIVLTIAADGGGMLDASSVTFGYLADALAAAGEPRRRVVLKSYEPLEFKVAALVYVDPDFETAKVLKAAQAAVKETLAFERRAFAQPVARSEVEATIQAVAGVVAVDLTELHLVGGSDVIPLLTASGARLEGNDIKGAQLLQLASDGIMVTTA